MDHLKLLEKLKNKEIKPYQLEQLLFKETKDWKLACKHASEIRLKYVEEATNAKLSTIKNSYISTEMDGKELTGIENKIGSAVIPLGYSGPVKINGEFVKDEIIMPLATNEAALIAGNNRGVSAINQAGGIKTIITKNCMTRAPLLELDSIESAHELVKEIDEQGKLYNELKNSVEEKSKFTKVIDIQPFQMGRKVWLRNVFNTGNAMGMNSVTKYSALMIKKLLELKPNIKIIALSGNMCSDKKAAHINILLGKGKAVEGEIIISRQVIEKVWGTTPETMIKVNNTKNWHGSALSGTFTGFNANAANAIAAFFAATGQDLAHIATSSSCFNVLEMDGDNLRYNITMPNIEVGSIGGGMYFGTAKECLDMIGCTGKDDGETNAKKVAEIALTAVAAQEINLIGTLANQFELAESHVKLARGEKK